nr:11964_t:CDS:2 [Entrophospora candida]
MRKSFLSRFNQKFIINQNIIKIKNDSNNNSYYYHYSTVYQSKQQLKSYGEVNKKREIQINLEDVMPTDDELKLASQHKSINLPITVQQEIIKTVLKTIIIADQKLREEKRNQILKLAGNNIKDITSLANLIISNNKYLDAEYSYASLIYNGYGGLPQNPFDAMEIYKKLAKMAHPASQYALATIYADQLNDYKTAIELYNLAGNNGLAKAWTNLGLLYQKGLGVEKDNNKAIEYFTKGADADERSSHFMLGVYYNFPDNTHKKTNYVKALKHYEVAASLGLPEAQYNLGKLFLDGKRGIIKKNQNFAMEYWKMSAFNGHQAAQA